VSGHETVEGQPPRLWAGTTLADRRVARRAKLLDAGLDLLGAEDPQTLSVRAVCRRAQLTERYFYENFADRDELVAEVYDRVAEEARLTLEQATQGLSRPADIARTATEAMVHLMLDDPRKGRVLLVAPLTEHQLTDRGLRALPVALSMIRAQLSPTASEADRDLIATGLMGALMSLFHAFLAGQLQVTREQLVEHCVRLLMSAPRLES
jgi:AcrR family transcriptional regulator